MSVVAVVPILYSSMITLYSPVKCFFRLTRTTILNYSKQPGNILFIDVLDIDDIMELLEFVVTTTYFTFRGVTYQQRFGTAMGSPVSPIIANLYMEWLEQRAIATAPVNCRPRLWKRFVDDTLEMIKGGSVTQLTEHLNSVDSTGSIRFTYEEETEGQIPFLDTLLIRKKDGNVKLLVYWKKTHTDQYLNFMSHHPLHQKLGVIMTLFNRCDNVVTEE